MLEMSGGTYWDLKGILSEIRSNYNCMDEEEEPYYRALSDAIRLVSAQPEIITCADCRYADGQIADGRYWCSYHEDYMRYCSDAERRQ